jgi:hypothetical protein
MSQFAEFATDEITYATLSVGRLSAPTTSRAYRKPLLERRGIILNWNWSPLEKQVFFKEELRRPLTSY